MAGWSSSSIGPRRHGGRPVSQATRSKRLSKRSAIKSLAAGWCLAAAAVAGGEGYEVRDGRCLIPKVQITTLEEVQIPAQEAGVVSMLEAREGMFVDAGQEIGRLDESQARLLHKQASREYAAARRQAENDINVQYAAKARDVSRSEFANAEDANQRVGGTITSSEMRRLKLAVDKAELQVEQAREDKLLAEATMGVKEVAIEMAEKKLERHILRAPLRGVVVEVFKRRGEWVDPGQPVVRVLRTDWLRAQGFLNVRDFGPELLGMPVSVVVDFPGGRREEFRGKIRFVSPEVEPVSGDFRFWAEVENRGLLLRPGLAGAMAIQLPPARAAGGPATPAGAAPGVGAAPAPPPESSGAPSSYVSPSSYVVPPGGAPLPFAPPPAAPLRASAPPQPSGPSFGAHADEPRAR